MLKNYYKIDEQSTVGNFLKEINDKKNSRYIILENGNSYVDFREIALNVKDVNEKLKTLKRPLSNCDSKIKCDCLNRLIESGDLVIKASENDIYDLSDAFKEILDNDYTFLNQTIDSANSRHEIFALNEDDKISSAKSLFKTKKTNLLPVLDKLQIIGELRPMDLLVNELFKNGNHEKTSYFSEKQDSILNLPISNIYNKKPLTISKHSTIRDALEILSNKSLVSIIVTNGNEAETQSNQDNEIYTVLSYKDIFRLIREDNKVEKYHLEILGGGKLYEDEYELIDIYSRRAMDKIAKMSDYDNLKLSVKTIGNTIGTHMRKVDIKLLLSHGNHIISVDKEIHSSIVDEDLHSHEKEKWNIPKMTQELLKNLQIMVKNEVKKHR
ncbi:MAG: CBS domain-containing protein [Nanoarchaeales archaeon]|nr:CBS domain-containing protein [Nanoarchaeales archaeon]